MAAFTPPVWAEGGDPAYLLGTDDQGRDLLSAILYGMRISLFVGFASVVLAMVLGVGLGLLAGYAGGWIDGLLMRIADVQISFPAILIALLIDGHRARHPAARGSSRGRRLGHHLRHRRPRLGAVRPHRARLHHGGAQEPEYVMAAHDHGGASGPDRIMRHVLPNVMGPVLVIATITWPSRHHRGDAVLPGRRLPPTEPSLGTLIRIGNDFLFSGEWWITIFPGVALVLLVLSVNLLGDWLRDALNPKLR